MTSVLLSAIVVIPGVAYLSLTVGGAGIPAWLDSAGFNLARFQSTAAHTVENLPPLSDANAAKAEELLRDLGVSTDERQGIAVYSPDSGYDTAVFLYIGTQESEGPELVWRIRYHGQRGWLRINRYEIQIDDQDPVTLRPTSRIRRRSANGSVWENFNEPAVHHAELLDQIMSGQTVRIRMRGDRGSHEMELSDRDLQLMRDMLLVYRFLGGAWPDLQCQTASLQPGHFPSVP